MAIFKGKHFNHDWMKGEIPNTLYGIPFIGWIDQELLIDRMDAKTVYSKHTINTDSPSYFFKMAILINLIQMSLE